MVALERRVQVVFSAEQYARLEAAAFAERVTVDAFIRDAVELRMQHKRENAREALNDLFAWADEHPIEGITSEQWLAEKQDL